MRTEVARARLLRLIRKTPFRPFLLNMENGDRIPVEHPENVSFDRRVGGRISFYVSSGRLHYFGTFEAVTGIARLETGPPLNPSS